MQGLSLGELQLSSKEATVKHMQKAKMKVLFDCWQAPADSKVEKEDDKVYTRDQDYNMGSAEEVNN